MSKALSTVTTAAATSLAMACMAPVRMEAAVAQLVLRVRSSEHMVASSQNLINAGAF